MCGCTKVQPVSSISPQEGGTEEDDRLAAAGADADIGDGSGASAGALSLDEQEDEAEAEPAGADEDDGLQEDSIAASDTPAAGDATDIAAGNENSESGDSAPADDPFDGVASQAVGLKGNATVAAGARKGVV